MGNTTEIQVTRQSMDPLCEQFLVRLLLLLESLQHAALSFHLTPIYSPLALSSRYQIARTSHAEGLGCMRHGLTPSSTRNIVCLGYCNS